MKSVIRAAVLFACAGAVFAQDELRSWVPSNWGYSWIYQHEFRESLGPDSKVQRWKTEETLEKPVAVPEGTIVIRKIRTFDGKPPAPQPSKAAWLIHGDCLYDLDPGDWDPNHPKELSSAFRAKPPWQGGEYPRVFCFPLSDGKTWGRKSGHEWQVAAVTEHDAVALDKGKTYHVHSDTGPGLTEDVLFERGVGIVKEDDVHNGEQSRSQLAFFAPAPQTTQGALPSPRGEIGVQYAYNSLTISQNGESNQSGGTVYGHYFLAKTGGWFGIPVEFSGSASNSGSLYTFLTGMSLTREWRRAQMTWPLDILVGASHVRVNGIGFAGLPVSQAQASFVWGVGYGLQYRAGDHFIVTLVRAELLSFEVPNLAAGGSHWYGDVRFGGGIGFRFGEK